MTGIATTAVLGQNYTLKAIYYSIAIIHYPQRRRNYSLYPPSPLPLLHYYDNHVAFCDFESNFFFLILPRLTFSDQH